MGFVNVIHTDYKWLLSELPENISFNEDEVIKYLYRKIIDKNKEVSRSIYIEPFFLYYKLKESVENEILDLLVRVVSLEDDSIMNLYYIMESNKLVIAILNKYSLQPTFIKHITTYCLKVEVSYFGYSRYIETLLKVYSYFKNLYGYDEIFIDALYRHISWAGDKNDYGYDFNGLSTVETYIKILDKDVLKGLLNKFESDACHNFHFGYYFRDMLEKQIKIIITHSCLNEKEKKEFLYYYLDGAKIKTIIINNLYINIRRKLDKYEKYSGEVVKNKEILSFRDEIKFEFMHNNDLEQNVKVTIQMIDDTVLYSTNIKTLNGERLFLMKQILKDDYIILHFSINGTEYEPENFMYTNECYISFVKLSERIESRIEKSIEDFFEFNEKSDTSESHTKNQIKDTYQQADNSDECIVILHLSDIHIKDNRMSEELKTSIILDIENSLQIKKINFIIISGDITIQAKLEEFELARKFIQDIANRFDIKEENKLVIPGNHDVNWLKSKNSYLNKESILNKIGLSFNNNLLKDIKVEESNCFVDVVIMERDENKYKERFSNFKNFYDKLKSSQEEEFSLEYGEQYILKTFWKEKIILLGLNSAWEIDHFYKNRASININAMSNAIDKLLLTNDETKDFLKISVVHHPVTGNNSMEDSFLQKLALLGFKIHIQGHLHKAAKMTYSFDDVKSIKIIAAGTSGADYDEQVTSIPLQYNIIKYYPHSKRVQIFSRKKEDNNGVWKADARWGESNNPTGQYEMNL